MKRLVFAIPAALVALAAVGGGAVARTTTRAPVTLTTVPGRVYAVAQSSAYVAWRRCAEVDVRRVDGTRYPPIPIVPSWSSGFGCGELSAHNNPIMEHDTLVLAGSTVSWSLYSKGNLDYVDFPAARIATGRTVSPFLPHLVLGPYDGTLLAGPASDGRSVVFGETQVENDATCLAQQQFDFTCPIVGTGRVWTVDSSLRRRRLASAAALLVAVADGRIAVVSRKDRALGFRTPEALVVVRNARDGSKLGTIAASGPPVALALSPSLGAVLVVRGTGRRIEWFDPRAIRPGDAIDVPDTVQTIGVAGRLVVYRVGRRIFGFRPPAAEPVLLAAASPAWTIVGPEITAKRLLWAEYGREKGRWVSRLRTLDVP